MYPTHLDRDLHALERQARLKEAADYRLVKQSGLVIENRLVQLLKFAIELIGKRFMGLVSAEAATPVLHPRTQK